MGGIVIVDSVSGGTTDGANKDLSNLTVTGEAKFKAPSLISSDAGNGLTSGTDNKLYINVDVSGKANTDLDNITTAGTSVITSLIASNITGKANTDLDNLSTTGQARFINYTTSITSGSTDNKTANLTGFTLFTGSVVDVVFTNTNTSNSPTLDINSTGAKAIAHENGVSVSSSNPAYFPAGAVIRFVYDGAKWRFKNVVVIASYTDGQPSSGYRIWADGYKEYQGRTSESATGLYNFTHTFEVPFVNSSSVVAHRSPNTTFDSAVRPPYWFAILSLDTTSITFRVDANNSQSHYWSVRGY
jgi:hypothetical protein